MKVSDNTSVSMPIRNMLAIIAAVAIGAWAYFGVIERLNKLETSDTLFQADLLSQSKNSSSNKVAKELKDRRYHQRVVKSKKVYDRKKNENYSRDS
jgi:hypothetical protein